MTVKLAKFRQIMQDGQPQTISGGGVVYNSEREILMRLPRNSSPPPNVPFPHPYVSFQTLVPCKAMALRGFLMSIGGVKNGGQKSVCIKRGNQKILIKAMDSWCGAGCLVVPFWWDGKRCVVLL